MSSLRTFRVYEDLVIPASGEHDLHVAGQFVACMESDQAEFSLGLDEGAPILFGKGIQVKVGSEEEFSLVRILNRSSSSALTVSVAIGFGELDDRRLAIPAGVDLSKPATITSTADVSIAATTTAQVLAANASRREAMITNLAANSDTFRIGDSNVGAARGVELAPGQTIVLTTTAEIQAYNPKAAPQSLAVIEVSE